MPRESREESITSAEADGAREVGGGVAAARARRSLAGALGRQQERNVNWTSVGLYAVIFYLLTIVEGIVVGIVTGFAMARGQSLPPWFQVAAAAGTLVINAMFFAVVAISGRLRTLAQVWVIVAMVGIFGLVINWSFLGVPVGDTVRDTVWEFAIVSMGFAIGLAIRKGFKRPKGTALDRPAA